MQQRENVPRPRGTRCDRIQVAGSNHVGIVKRGNRAAEAQLGALGISHNGSVRHVSGIVPAPRLATQNRVFVVYSKNGKGSRQGHKHGSVENVSGTMLVAGEIAVQPNGGSKNDGSVKHVSANTPTVPNPPSEAAIPQWTTVRRVNESVGNNGSGNIVGNYFSNAATGHRDCKLWDVAGLIEQMLSYIQDDAVQLMAMRTIVRLCAGSAIDRVRVVQFGAIKAIVMAMAFHPDNFAVQSIACTAIASVCEGQAEHATEVHGAGGIVQVLMALKKFVVNRAKDAVVCRSGTLAIASLCEDHGQNRNHVMELGGAAAVLTAMRAHERDAKVQSNGCLALARICTGNFRLVSSVVGMTEGHGGIGVIASAMKTHAGDEVVQSYSLMAIANLCYDHVDNGELLCKTGGIGLIVSSMSANRLDASIQSYGCLAIANVCGGNAGIRSHVANEGGIVETLILAIKAHPNNDDVMSFGSRAVAEVCRDHPRNCSLAQEFLGS